MYKIVVSPKAIKELKIIKKLHREAFKKTLEALMENPYDGKPLSKEMLGKYSYRVGVYRIIYSVNKKDRMINVITAGHRGIVYQ
ncbi:MAG: type II toxin-antitoxin system RelE/ParE family toxin [bacterium]|nr:type II toxin-antitoxin system RelE/ParE family toxin [bacterium]